MVAQERIKRAETEEELRDERTEKEALKSALRVVEGENGKLRSRQGKGSVIYPDVQEPADSGPEGIKEEMGEKEGEGRRAIDLGEGGVDGVATIGGRRGIDEPREVEKLPLTNDVVRSRSSSRVGVKSPVRSRRSSISELVSEAEGGLAIPAPTESQPSIPPDHNTSPWVSLDELEDYATPMSQPESEPQSSSDVLHTHKPDHRHNQSNNGDEDERRDHSGNSDTLSVAALPNTTPSSASLGNHFSRPNPTFKSSLPGNYLVDEPSPWASV
jgi:hypothetical protein